MAQVDRPTQLIRPLQGHLEYVLHDFFEQGTLTRPNLFYGIKFWTVCRPVQDIYIICCQTLPGYCCRMWTGIIVHEGDIWTMYLKEQKSFHSKNIIYVSLSINTSIDND